MAPSLTPSERRRALEFVAHRQKYGGQWRFFEPYARQIEFFELGDRCRERLLIAGNQLGKTHAGAFEVCCHATGRYPSWWTGRKWDRPTKGWACGETSLAVRDILQKKLCGEPGVDVAFGSGMIAKEDFADKPSLARGVTDAYDTIQVRHVSGGVSIIRFKSYEQGRAKFQGETLDWVWFDEEPPLEIYSEGLTRTTATGGMVFVTFTPMNGPTSTVLRFRDEPSPDRSYVTMRIDEVGHISAADRERIIAGYPAHERDARAYGIPMLGSGRIFITPDDMIVEEAIAQVPIHWAKLWGIDFGIGHPFAAVLIAWDRDEDVIHILHAIRMANTISLVQAHAMLKVCAAAPVAWPRDGTERDRNTGEPLHEAWRKLGPRMLHEHAQWEGGSVSTEAGIQEWDEREKTGRLKVPAHLTEWWGERATYHRKDGKIVKIGDDLMSATRVALMMKRFAKAVPLGGAKVVANSSMPQSRFARGTPLHEDGDINPFTGT